MGKSSKPTKAMSAREALCNSLTTSRDATAFAESTAVAGRLSPSTSVRKAG